MPIYEYLCEKCGHEFEREQRITADPIKTCPECKARKVKKLISQTSFVLKGGGWYNDLYSSTKKGDASEGADSKGESAKSDKSEKSSKEASKSGDDSGSKKKGGKKGGKASKSAA
ncbi:MAG: zinc ribbon domain-containing protein [Myxococcota bacterium]|nr:zinc ribbon domain-containing protein [Myxococcota bacterium]